jgi:hypothetical protein
LEVLQAVARRLEGHVRKRFDIHAAEQVVHHGVTHHRDALDAPGAGTRRVEQSGGQLSKSPSHQSRQLRLPSAQGVLHAAHDVCAVGGLRVQGCAHCQDTRSAQVQKLGHQCRRAQIDRDPESFARLELEGGVVRKNRCVHLRDFEGDSGFGVRVAGQTPAALQFLRCEKIAIGGSGRQAPFHHTDTTAPAAPAAAAGELDTESEQRVAQRRALLDFQALT